MQKITLNLIPDGVPPVVYVNQFDTGREFQISFKEGLSPYNFPSGVVFRINGRKADNHVFEYTESDKWDASHNIITKSGSGTSLTVTIATSEQMTAAAGDAEVQLTFKSSSASNDILGTLNFILAVQEKPDVNGDPSESDLPDRVESVNGIGPDANGNVLLPPALGAIGAHNIAPVEPTRIMSTARAAGTQVYVTADDQLYDIISPIGSGGTLTPGTNAIASSISSDLANKLSIASSYRIKGRIVCYSGSGSGCRSSEIPLLAILRQSGKTITNVTIYEFTVSDMGDQTNKASFDYTYSTIGVTNSSGFVIHDAYLANYDVGFNVS